MPKIHRESAAAERGATTRAATGGRRTAKIGKAGPTPTAKVGTAGKRTGGERKAPRAPRAGTLDLVVELPGGSARISIEAKAGVRRTASEWVRLVEALAQTALSPGELLAGLRPITGTTDTGQHLTPAERDELAAAGAHPAGRPTVEARRGDWAAWQVVTMADALDVATAAQLLGVDPTRVRQRLRDRTLYGVRGDGRTWRLPRFQFDENGQEIPHLGEVLRALPPDLHPRSVEGFLSAPKPELVTEGEPTDPREWLRTGGSAEPVVALAASLAAQ